MIFKTVYRFLPVFIFSFKCRLFKYFKISGITLGNIVLLDAENKYKDITIKHELIHVKQFYRTLGLFCLLYLVSSRKRIAYEIEAYHATLKGWEAKGYKVTSNLIKRYVDAIFNLYYPPKSMTKTKLFIELSNYK